MVQAHTVSPVVSLTREFMELVSPPPESTELVSTQDTPDWLDTVPIQDTPDMADMDTLASQEPCHFTASSPNQ